MQSRGALLEGKRDRVQMTNVTQNRPLSPHLSIYKPIPTMVMSIVHRITGVALYAGTVRLRAKPISTGSTASSDR